jgi:hypothetical protein
LQAAESYGTNVTEFSFDMKPPITPNEKEFYPLSIPGKTK